MPRALRYTLQLSRLGCTNRPFYNIVVAPMLTRKNEAHSVEQVGTFDPIPNIHDEKLVGLNVHRIKYWIGRGVAISVPVAELLGYSGLLPLHPQTFIRAAEMRKRMAKVKLEKENEANNDQTDHVEVEVTGS